METSLLIEFHEKARPAHCVMTPLLFLPLWRDQMATIRDHSINTPKDNISKPPKNSTTAAAASVNIQHMP